MAIFRSLTFDGVNSLDYGIYITGEAVYNAPERAVEMVTIPGKNGALAIDQGRFENIEVIYHAGCFADNQADFAEKVMKFRNALASRYTYRKLTDEYHSDEYRLGLYKSGLEVDSVHYSTAGEFDITFECKPQRFLTNGETALTPSDYIDTQTATGEIVTIDSDGSLGVKSLKVALDPIQSGSGIPSPDNVRPISGRTEVVTQRTGKNLLPPSPNILNGIVYSDGYYNVNLTTTGATEKNLFGDWGIQNAVSLGLKEGDYCWKDTVVSVDGGAICHCFIRVSQHGTQSYERWEANSTRHIYDDDKFFIILYFGDANTSYKCRIGIQLELGSTATDYEPYQGTTYTTSLGQTVYGGVLDVVSGELVVDRAMVDLETLNWTLSGGFFRTDGLMSTVKKPINNQTVVNAISSAYPIMTWTAISTTDTAIAVDTTGRMIDTAYSNVSESDFKTAMDGVQLCYELANPQTIQLTPQEVQLLLGTNNVWSDGGEITVTYGVHPYYNPSPFDSKPLIKVTGTGTLGIGEYILTITGTATQAIYIDCETMEIYTYEGTVPTGASSLVSINKNDFPVLKPGINNISVGSGITAVTITPRWWRI